MKNKTYKVIIKNTLEVSSFLEPYLIHSIHGAAEVIRNVDGRLALPRLGVGDRLSLQAVKELIDNPANDVTVTL